MRPKIVQKVTSKFRGKKGRKRHPKWSPNGSQGGALGAQTAPWACPGRTREAPRIPHDLPGRPRDPPGHKFWYFQAHLCCNYWYFNVMFCNFGIVFMIFPWSFARKVNTERGKGIQKEKENGAKNLMDLVALGLVKNKGPNLCPSPTAATLRTIATATTTATATLRTTPVATTRPTATPRTTAKATTAAMVTLRTTTATATTATTTTNPKMYAWHDFCRNLAL